MDHPGLQATVPSPAKVNLCLAILGKRPDGFHDLFSLVATLDFGDRIRVGFDPASPPEGDRVAFRAASPQAGPLPPDDVNSVSRALALWRQATGFDRGAFTVEVEKQIPPGSGLGGGSSNAVAVLKALERLSLPVPRPADLAGLSGRLGSDCPLFLETGPVLLEGRGEQVTRLEPELARRLRGLPLLLFKPGFPVPTAEAYQRLARAGAYTPSGQAHSLLEDWQSGGLPLPAPHNDFEELLADWMPTLPIVLRKLRQAHRMDARLSGSGSCSFVVAGDHPDLQKVLQTELFRAWGPRCWMQATRINQGLGNPWLADSPARCKAP